MMKIFKIENLFLDTKETIFSFGTVGTVFRGTVIQLPNKLSKKEKNYFQINQKRFKIYQFHK